MMLMNSASKNGVTIDLAYITPAITMTRAATFTMDEPSIDPICFVFIPVCFKEFIIADSSIHHKVQLFFLFPLLK